MATSAAQKRATNKWNKENMKVVSVKLRIEQANRFKTYCDTIGKSANEVLREYIASLIDDPDTTQDS